MRFLSVRELRQRGRQVWRHLRSGEQAVLTVSGSPVAILIGVEEDRLEETLRRVRQALAQEAVDRMREAARTRGLDRLSQREVEREIRAARGARRS
jgi:antitoxin (DNA-binding transcriptional repressor) of toxin-antitoxin stability system